MQKEITPEFIQTVHEIVATVPAGKVATYGQIAEMAGIPGAAQEVGHIMSRVRADQNLPCHRIVNKAGTMTPNYAFGGADKQREMLEKEGVRFKSNGRIDMENYQWGNDEQLTLF